MALPDFKDWDAVEEYLDANYGRLHEYTVIAYDVDGDGHAFPMFAKDTQSAFKNFDAMYLQVCNTGQVYPYGLVGSRMDEVVEGIRRIELLDYLSEEVLASYGVG